jgi:hypothetical protein
MPAPFQLVSAINSNPSTAVGAILSRVRDYAVTEAENAASRAHPPAHVPASAP